MSQILVDSQQPNSQKGTTQGVDLRHAQTPSNSDQPIAARSWIRRECTLVNIVSAALFLLYAVAFVKSFDGRWFNPLWTTDDAAQQTYPFHEVLKPGLFEGDLITEAMKGYLPPLHWGVNAVATYLTGDPIMAGHWVMLLQVSLAVTFLFLAVRSVTATGPAFLAALWLLHSRHTIQRMTGGLPRGWTPALFAMFFYFAFRKNHWGVLAVIFAGAMLNPPGTLIIGVAYGALLLWRWAMASAEERGVARKRILSSIAVAPLFGLVALTVIQRPPHIGQMVSFEQASQMPEFSRPKGRFPFLPLNPVSIEFKFFGMQAFVGRFHSPPRFVRANIVWIAFGALGITALVALFRRRLSSIPAEVVIFGLAALCTYTLSRIFAFKLYVPDRHIQIPMVFFFITAFVVGVWRALHKGSPCVAEGPGSVHDTSLKSAWSSALGLMAVGALVFVGSGLSLSGDANFNYNSSRRGGMHKWFKANTTPEALIACHPTHCDGMQLFAERRAYVTTETTHPFYQRYNQEMQRRSEIALKAHFSEKLEDVVTVLEPEGITHFVFRAIDFRPDRLPNVSYFPPLDGLVRSMVTRPSGKFAYFEVARRPKEGELPFVVFRDSVSVVVDIKALSAYLRERGWAPPQTSLNAAMQRHAASRNVVVARGAVEKGELRS